MSAGVTVLHSHSGLERELHFPKHTVLIDAKYKDLFEGSPCELFEHDGIEYYKVNIYSFVMRGGVFKNLLK